MEQWEYWTGFLWANIETKGVIEYVKNRWPNWFPAKYAPQTMIPELDGLGEKGWELVHMEPVPGVGNNYEVRFQSETSGYVWSNTYFCVFKRRKQS